MEKQILTLTAGLDEAGRGPLAGPVSAAAVVFRPDRIPPGLNDSKKLTPTRREKLMPIIKEEALAWGIALCTPEEIDRLNIHHASLTAMARAWRQCLEKLRQQQIVPLPDKIIFHIQVDGKFTPTFPPELMPPGTVLEAVIKGDSKVKEIMAASILAKVTRDTLMENYDKQYPGYGFAAHKGYPTAAHRKALQQLGLSPIHRRSFRWKPV